MTDTPRRRPPLPTREGTLKIKPRSTAPADSSPAAKPGRPGDAPIRKRGKASYPDQADTAPVRRSPRADDDRPRGFGDRARRPDGERPARPYGDRPDRGDRPPRSGDDRPRGFGDRGPRPDGERPARPYGDRPERGERPARPEGDARPPRHERKQWSGEARPAPAPAEPQRDDGTLRLSKRMAELGLCSRREADEYIEKGWVRVDGRVISELGARVRPEQAIELDRRGQTAQDRRVTILLNKPVGYVSGQAEDGYEPASVLITAENRWAEDPSETRFLNTHHRGLAPAGRLDIDSIGLLVFTQDGRIARALIGEDSAIEKEYHVRVEGTLDAEGLRLLNHGLSLDGEALRPAKVSWLNEDQLRFVLREGKKRQIRRMCELVGLKVVGLKRVRIGRVMLGNLPPGQWRYLAANELF